MTYATPEENEILKLILNAVLDVVDQYEKDLQYMGYMTEVASGALKGQYLMCFRSKIPELYEISEILFPQDKILDELRATQMENGEYDPKLIVQIRNNIARSILGKINDDVKPYLSSNRFSIKSDDVCKLRELFISLNESNIKSQTMISEDGSRYTIFRDEFSIDGGLSSDKTISEIKMEMLRLIWETIMSNERDLKITAALYEENSKQLWRFNPTDYDQIKYYLIDPEPYFEKLKDTAYSSGFEKNLQQVVAEVTEQILKNYISPIKNIVVLNTNRSSTAENSTKKPYHNQFDHKLVDFIKLVFNKGLNMEIDELYSNDLGNNCFEIRVSTNTDIHLTMFYILEDSRAQLQLGSIRISPYHRGKGISKLIINNLFKFCSEMENTELLIVNIINEEWELYLRTKGAVLIKKDERAGDALKIADYI